MKIIIAILFTIFFHFCFSQDKITKYYIESKIDYYIECSVVSKDSATKYSIEYFDTSCNKTYKEFYDIKDNSLLKRAYYINDSTIDGLLVKYLNGKLRDSCFMKMGKLSGFNYFYYNNGKLASIVDFSSDTSVFVECFDGEGKVKKCEERVEMLPEFPGEDGAYLQYLKSIIRYPKDAKKKGIEGKVVLKFYIDIDGKVKGTKIIKSVYPSLDEEALRVINEMPDWKPGTQYGRKVKVYYMLPITFKL